MAADFVALARRSWAVVVSIGVAATGVGCNAIAGIELGTLAPDGSSGGVDATTSGDGSPPSDDGATAKPDSGSSDAGGGGSDGGADSGAPTYTCVASSPASPFVVASLESADAGRQFNFNITLGTTTNQGARIFVEHAQGNSGEAFHVYEVRWAPTSLNSSYAIDAGSGYLNNAEVTSSGMTAVVLEQSYASDGGNANTPMAYPFPADNQQGQFGLPPPYPLTPPLSNFNGSVSFLELAPNDDFVITRPVVGNGSILQSSRTRPDGGVGVPTTFGSSTQQHNDSPTLVHGGNSVFAMFGSDPGVDAGTVVYKLPDDGVNAGPVTPVLLPTNVLLAGAYPSTVDPTKVATFTATLVTTPVPQFTLYAGLVDAAHFDGLQLSALTRGPSLGVHDVPAGKSGSAFLSDQLAIVGLSPAAGDQGINFVWIDTSARVLSQAVGSSRLYANRPGIQAAAIAPAQNIAGVVTTFFIAWIEEPTDGMGPYDVLYLDQIGCTAN